MEKRDIALICSLVAVAVVVIFLISQILADPKDRIIPLPNGGNGEPQIERTEWAFTDTQIKNLNNDELYGEGVVIGIVDSGIDITHPDLDHINITAWKDYVNDRAEPYDDNGHGTFMAGIIAAQGEIDGVAPKVRMIVVKAISSSGTGTESDVADGIDFCVENGADVICLSLGGRARFLNLGDETAYACEDAIDQGVFVVAAAGNDGEDDDGDVSSPATVDGVIAVGAIDEDWVRAPFSSLGDNDGVLPIPFDDRKDPDKKPELVAPGVDIVSTWLNHEYRIGSGTSQATAFVAGGIVLLLDAHPQYQRVGSDTVTQFKNVFMDTAETCPGQDTPHDDHYGYGLIQLADAEDQL